MNITRYLEATSTNYKSIPIKTGNIIYIKDTGDHYFDDSTGRRIKVGDIISISTEDERQSIISPITNKIYLVLSTGKMYLFKDTWVPINATPDTATILVESSSWSQVDLDGINMYMITVNHNLNTRNIVTATYNSNDQLELVGIEIVDNNTIKIYNTNAIDCTIIVK